MSNKIKLTILVCIVLIGIIFAIFIPYTSRLSSLDFKILESNGNFQFEVDEELFLNLNDSTTVKDKKVVWYLGNGDSVVKSGNISYKYKKQGNYLVTIAVNKKFIVSKKIGIVKLNTISARDSLVVLHGIDEAYVGDELVFFTEGEGIDTWYWEFGETGTVDAYDQKAKYKYSTPGKYRVKLQTNTLKYPIYHNINILPRFEIIKELEKIDSLGVVQDDIKKKLQAIANCKVSDSKTFYKNLNYIKDTYTCNNAQDLIVIVNGAKYNKFYSYCQGLHYLENNGKERVIINKVEIDTLKCFKELKVTQQKLQGSKLK